MQSSHIIQKQYVELVSTGEGDGIALQRGTERIIRMDLLPKLKQLFDDLIPVDRVLVIDRLFVELSDLSPEDFDREFSNMVLEEVERQLLKYVVPVNAEPTIGKRLSISQRKIETLCYYLEKGYFPWWSNVKSLSDWKLLLSEIIHDLPITENWNAIQMALHTESVRIRFVNLFKESTFWEIISRTKLSGKTQLRPLEDDLKLLQSNVTEMHERMEIETSWKILVLKYWLSIISKAEMFQGLNQLVDNKVKHLPEEAQSFRKSFVHAELKQILVQQERKISQKLAKEMDFTAALPSPIFPTEEIYLANAGLVIIAPYLPMFFQNLQICEGNLLLQKDRAIALLHYLVYGTDRYEEFECTLSKVICGMQAEELILRVALTKEDIAEADALLKAIISHWQVLKSTSPDGLRQSFLQREGRLLFHDGEWQLTVQRETHDILLGQLPWNIHLIKLPWMNHLLKVDWN